jgi:hypothetical protein
MVLSWDVHRRLCRLPGVCLACFGLGAMAIVPAFHDASFMVREFNWCPRPSCLTVSQGFYHDVLITVECYIPTLNPEFHFVFNSHFCTSFVPSRCHAVSFKSLIYLHINAPCWGFNLGANAPPCINVYIYALFTCPTSPPHCVLPLNLHHYHKVLQHIEVLC